MTNKQRQAEEKCIPFGYGNKTQTINKRYYLGLKKLLLKWHNEKSTEIKIEVKKILKQKLAARVNMNESHLKGVWYAIKIFLECLQNVRQLKKWHC